MIKKFQCEFLTEVDFSVTNFSGKWLFSKSRLRNLRRLYLDFCPKIDAKIIVDNFATFCPNVVYASVFGTLDIDAVVELRRRQKTLKTVIVGDVTSSSERDMRDFAKKRGLTLSNWMITQQRLVKPQQPMLSQIFLQSYRDL